MKRIKINGVIIPNDYQRVYDWLEWDATSPRKVEKELADADGDITVEINSGGGSVFDGSEIYTMLKRHSNNVTVEIVGLAASAASIIAMAGDKVVMSPTSQMMIHNATSVSKGDYRDMDSASQLLKNANRTAVNAYKAKSGMDEDELFKLMDAETWFTPQQALENGLIDEIMFEESVQLSASISGLLPQDVVMKLNKELFKKEHKKSSIGKPTNKASDFLLSKMKTKLQLLKLKGDVKQ